MTASRGCGKIYALPRIEAILSHARDSELVRLLRSEVKELRSELRSAGFNVPLRYGALSKPAMRKRIAELHQAGVTQVAIATDLGVTRQRIQQILKIMGRTR